MAYLQTVAVVSLLFTGKGVYGFLTGCKGRALRVLQKIFRHRKRCGVFVCKNLDSLKPYTGVALKQ